MRGADTLRPGYVARLRPQGRRALANDVGAHWIFGAGVVAWIAIEVFAVLLSPPPLYVDGEMLETSNALQRGVQYAGALAIAFAAVLRPLSMARFYQAALERDVAAFCIGAATVLILAVSALSLNLMGALYAALLALTLAACTAFWSMSAERRRFWINAAMWACVAFGAVSIALYWPPQGRWLGGMHPNIFSFPLVFAAVASLVYAPRARFVITPFALFLCAAVSSRYALLSICLALVAVLYLTLRRRFSDAVLIGAAVIAGPALYLLLSGPVSEVLLLNDQTRGLAGGATGRADLTASALNQIAERPWFGFGFRNKAAYEGAHNGFVNFLIEVGVPTAALFVIGIAVKVFNTAREALRRNGDGRDALFVVALLAACCFSAYFQPQLVNFGDLQGVALIFALTFVSRARGPNREARPLSARSRRRRGEPSVSRVAREGAESETPHTHAAGVVL